MNSPNDNVKDLRDEIVDLQKQNQKFKKDLEELRSRIEADANKNKHRSSGSKH
jgi:predicted  nucleic acid-binding Zn-ribbon protein